MKIIKKYTAIIIDSHNMNDNVIIDLSYGQIKGPYYDETSPTEIHDTEEDAIKYAFKFDPWASWLIVPLIKFDNY